MMLHFPIRRVAAPLLVVAVLLLALPGTVAAHAQLKTGTPADKSTVTAPVTVVSGIFTQRMDAGTSKLVVKLVGGGTVAQGGVDPADSKKMVATPSTPLGSGSYVVEWTTLSLDDGELARGTWTFKVAVAPTPSPTPVSTVAPTAVPSATASAAAPTAAPTPVASPPASVAPTPAPSGDGSSTGSGGDVVLPIVVALIVLGAGAAYLFTRRGQRPVDPT